MKLRQREVFHVGIASPSQQRLVLTKFLIKARLLLNFATKVDQFKGNHNYIRK
jgi:hypothetical protein